MPVFEYTTRLDAPAERVFEFLVRPSNLPLVAPPSPRLKLIESPPRLFLGAEFTVKVTKWFVSQLVVSRVTRFEDGVMFTDEQVRGPFRHWSHTHELSVDGTGTRMTDHLNFEAPGGVIGWYFTKRRLEQVLTEMFQWREKRFRELTLPSPANSGR